MERKILSILKWGFISFACTAKESYYIHRYHANRLKRTGVASVIGSFRFPFNVSGRGGKSYINKVLL